MEKNDRPNIRMESLVNEAIVMAADSSRSEAAEFLFRQGCPLDVIARVLDPASHSRPRFPDTAHQA